MVGQRDGSHTVVPRCESSGSLSVPWNSGIACQNLDFFIRFRSDVWPGEGRQCCSVTPCQGVFLTPARTLIFSFGSGVTFGRQEAVPSRRARGFWLALRAWNSGIACQNLDFFIWFRSDVWPGQRDGRRPWSTPWSTPWSHHPHVCFCTLISTLPITDKHRI